MANNSICSVAGCIKPVYAKGFCGAHYKRNYKHGSPTAGGITPGDQEKFIDQVALTWASQECLTWPFGSGRKRYNTTVYRGTKWDAHRLVCALVNGAPPDGHEAAHSCGNTHCVSPSHLRWKTSAGNEEDKVVHGTSQHGENNHAAKLSEDDVRSIRSAVGKVTQSTLARKYGVTQQTISAIQNRSRWQQVT